MQPPYLDVLQVFRVRRLELKRALEACDLDVAANDSKEARLAERGLEEDAEVLEVVEPFGVDPTLEIELTREFELDASLNADLENEDQFDENKLSFELPREASHGDLACNAAMVLAKAERLEPAPRPTLHLAQAKADRPEPAPSRPFALSE